MNPRTAPNLSQVDEHTEASEDLYRYQPDAKFTNGMMDAINFWQETASCEGLPAHWQHWRIFTVGSGDTQANWRVYLRTFSQIRMGFAESEDGQALHLLMLAPAAVMKLAEAHEVLSKRVEGIVK